MYAVSFLVSSVPLGCFFPYVTFELDFLLTEPRVSSVLPPAGRPVLKEEVLLEFASASSPQSF